MTEKEKSHGSAFSSDHWLDHEQADEKTARDQCISHGLPAKKTTERLLHHSDRGSQYASYDYQNLWESYGMQAGMSRKGNCWDIETMERWVESQEEP
jgi:transposase InsO family protein